MPTKQANSRSIRTVNVIDFTDGLPVPNRLKSYPDTKPGVKAAEETFCKWIKEVCEGMSKEDLEDALDFGTFELRHDKVIIITHST